MQATLTYAAELDELVGAGNDTAAEEAEGVAFFRTIAPLVAQVRCAGSAACNSGVCASCAAAAAAGQPQKWSVLAAPPLLPCVPRPACPRPDVTHLFKCFTSV